MSVKPLKLTGDSRSRAAANSQWPWPLWWKPLLLRKKHHFALDLMVLTSAFYLAYLLRFDFSISSQQKPFVIAQMLYVIAFQFGALALCGVYAFVWRYIGMNETKAFLQAALLSVLPILTIRLGTPGLLKPWRVPLSIIIMDTILAFGGVLGLRVLRRALYERYEKRAKVGNGKSEELKRVLLIGAGRAGVLTAREITGRGDMDLDIVGFVDDDTKKLGSVIHGVTVLGTTHDLPRLVREERVDHVVITIAEAPRRDIKRIVGICEAIPVRVQIIPGIYEILQGNVAVSRIRDVQIEDLLGREPVHLDEDAMRRFLAGKRVMVTGAGGSIGSELARQIGRFDPACLLLVERAEFALFDIDHEMRSTSSRLSIVPLVADVGDDTRMSSIFREHRPQVLLHAAAHKHVPMMEANPGEAVKNNVLNTRLLGELAGKHGVDVFVLISTDKAVRPTSLMGACKRVAELVVQDLNRRFETRYMAVRFGNVMGSAGSVIPIFREQIRRGGPVTITHPEMTRYFMTIPEASQLVLQAGAMGNGGEIFILDMGEPVRVLDLAKEMITLSGLKPLEDIDMVFTGVRPGEKLCEELETSADQISVTAHPKILIGKIAAVGEGELTRAVERLEWIMLHESERELRVFLNELLPDARITELRESDQDPPDASHLHRTRVAAQP